MNKPASKKIKDIVEGLNKREREIERELYYLQLRIDQVNDERTVLYMESVEIVGEKEFYSERYVR